MHSSETRENFICIQYVRFVLIVLLFQIFSLGAWRKQRVIGQTYDSDDDNLDDSPDTSMQQVSLKKKLFKERSRKRLDEVFPMKSGKKLINSSSSSIPDNGSPTVEIVHHEYERRPVDVEALRLGLIRFRFLMNASQPGAVPDPNIVAAMLDLVSYTEKHKATFYWTHSHSWG